MFYLEINYLNHDLKSVIQSVVPPSVVQQQQQQAAAVSLPSLQQQQQVPAQAGVAAGGGGGAVANAPPGTAQANWFEATTMDWHYKDPTGNIQVRT